MNHEGHEVARRKSVPSFVPFVAGIGKYDYGRYLAFCVSGALLWGSAMALCCVVNALLAVPDLVQLIIGTMIIAVTALIYLRTPAISLSDRALLASVLGPKPARLLRAFGLQMPAAKR